MTVGGPIIVRALRAGFAAAIAIALLGPDAGRAHEASFGLAGRKLSIQTKRGKPLFRFVAQRAAGPTLSHDPSAVDTWLLVRGSGENGGTTGRIVLDRTKWRSLGKGSKVKGYRYLDKSGTRGGVEEAPASSTSSIDHGSLLVRPDIAARCKAGSWKPRAPT